MTATYFYQECPTCGRALRVKINYLGKTVVCDHCQGSFTASDPAANAREVPAVPIPSPLERAEQLLAKLDHRNSPLEFADG